MLRIMNPGAKPPAQAAPQPPAGGPPPPGGGGGLPPELAALMAQGGDSPDGGDPGAGPKPPKYDAQKTTQAISGYLGPESGPFACGNCIHFEGPQSCGLVAGDIDPNGCCNLFESAASGQPDQDDDQDQGAPPVPPPGA